MSAGPCVREGASPLPSPALAPLAFFFLCKGLGGTGQGSASEHFMSLRGKPHNAAGTRGARPFGSCRATTCPSPTSRRPPAPRLPRATLSECFSFSLLLLRDCFQRKDRRALLGHKRGTRGGVHGFYFLIRTFLLYWSQPRAHSILFVDFWAHVFYGH